MARSGASLMTNTDGEMRYDMLNNNSVRLASVILAILLAGCANPGIVQLSPDTYLLMREDHAGVFGSMAKLKAGVIRDANKFAENQGKVAVPVSSKERPVGGFAEWARFEYQFKVINKDDREAVRTTLQRDPDVVIHEKKAVSAEIDINANDSNQSDLYSELVKLDDLRKRGIITESEFEEQKRRILNSPK